MFSSNYIHIDSVIENVLRKIPVKIIDKYDACQWVWECMGYIDSPVMLIPKTVVISISNYKALLPQDFYTEADAGVRHNDNKVPFIKTADIHFLSADNLTSDTAVDTIVNEGTSLYVNPDGTTNEDEIESFYSGYYNLPTGENMLKYMLRDGYIYTNITDFDIELSYKAFPVYQDFTPMIPEEPKIVRAIESYIIYMIAVRLRWEGSIDNQLFNWAETQYYLHVGSAQNKLKLESIDKMEAIKNRMLSLIPRSDEHFRGFGTMGNTQFIQKI